MITTARVAQRRLHYRYEAPFLAIATKFWDRRARRLEDMRLRNM